MKKEQILAIKDWLVKRNSETEIAFRPTRVLMQDYTGIPAVADLAAMRDAMKLKKKIQIKSILYQPLTSLLIIQ